MNRYVARHAVSRRIGAPVRRFLARSFSRKANIKVILYYNANRISHSQAYPFLHYAPRMAGGRGVEIRAVPIDGLLAGADLRHGGADLAMVQPWFTADPDALAAGLGRLQRANPGAPVVFLDSYAHNDLRLGRHVEPFVRHYVKKSLFRDRGLYLRPWRGGTNLSDYYGPLYGREKPAVDWSPPEALLGRLRVGPNFFTAPRFLDAFSSGAMPPRADRPIDLHARLGRQGEGWYDAMRRDAKARLGAFPDLRVASEGRVPLEEFMREITRSRLCFSPFGYGELCWRDIEAIQAGSVLIKPDMSHLETLPDLYEAGVTYLPVRWDFADLEEVVRGALADEDRMAAIATEAWRRVADYVRQDRFVRDMDFLFEGL